mgnify:FL=1
MLNFKLNNDLKDLQIEIGEDNYRTFSVILKRANNYYHSGIFVSIGSIALLVIDIFYFHLSSLKITFVAFALFLLALFLFITSLKLLNTAHDFIVPILLKIKLKEYLLLQLKTHKDQEL